MSAAHVLNLQQSLGHGRCLLAVGTTRSLRLRDPMQLRVFAGRAWVTLDDGPHGWHEDSGDLLLLPGQSLTLAPGRHVVIEPLGHEALQYQWLRPAVARSAGRQVAGIEPAACPA